MTYFRFALRRALSCACFLGLGVTVSSAQAQLPQPAWNDGSTPTETTETYQPPEETPAPPARHQDQPAEKPQLKSLTVGGVSIRGITDVAAIKKLQAAHDAKLDEYVTLWDGKDRHRIQRRRLGASIPYYKLLALARTYQQVGGDIPLRFEVDAARLQRVMKYLSTKINRTPSDARLDVENGQAVLKGGEGAELAVQGSVLRAKAALENEPPQSYVELVVARQPGTSTLRQFKYLLAEYSTPYDANIRGRTNNLKMAARNVNGEIVAPGKIFSTNQAIGPRNAAAGWREAKMFVDGQVVDGIGAGICQCSTTIYNAALLANLPIVERHQHTFKINYAAASRDAAIYWGQKDMRWKNNTGGPIYVQTFVTGKRFHARLFGTTPNKAQVEIESKVLSRSNGIRSEAYRVVKSGDQTTRQRLSRDYYRPKKG